jgi:RNA-binding protein
MTAADAKKLSGAALRKLRALGHALSPVVAIGKEGMSESLVRAVDATLGTHELVKVKIQREAPIDRHEAGIELAARTGSVLAQVVGRTLLLYRRHPKKPKIVLPVPGKPEKRAEKKADRPAPPRTSAKPVETEEPAGEDPGDND